MDPDHAAAIEEAIWERMHFATHLRARRLGEFTIGTELYRSESLALVQLLILYHLVTRARPGRAGRRRDAHSGGSHVVTVGAEVWETPLRAGGCLSPVRSRTICPGLNS